MARKTKEPERRQARLSSQEMQAAIGKKSTGQLFSPSMTAGVLIGLILFLTLTTLSSTTRRERSESKARL
jgi:formate/nitrite transporter FocA (FNT family)